MDSNHVNMPLRGGKKMRKRKELDALVANSSVAKRGPCAVPAPVVAKRGLQGHDNLLSDSSDEVDDYWSGVGGGGEKMRCRRRFLLRRRACSAFVRTCAVVLLFACVVATTTVMWLFIDIREQVTALRTELDQAVAGSQHVPSEIQECHSLAKELQKNQTILFDKLNFMVEQFSNYTSKVSTVQSDLMTLQKGLNNLPPSQTTYDSVVHDIANFGSQINSLSLTITSIKEQNAELQEATKTLFQNVTSLKASMDKLSNSSQSPYPVNKETDAQIQSMLSSINLLSSNMSHINDTLSQKVQWVMEDQSKEHKRIDTLSDGNLNVSARLTTVEGDYVKISSQEKLRSTVTELSNKVNSNYLHLLELDSNLTVLTTDYSNISKNVQNIFAQLKSNKPALEESVPVSTPNSAQVSPASQQPQQNTSVSTTHPLD